MTKFSEEVLAEAAAEAAALRVTLHAEDLWSKSGFRDGDILGDFWPTIDFQVTPDLWVFSEEELTLVHLVETRLLPLIPIAVKTMRIGSSHNNIRAFDWYENSPPAEAVGISLEIGIEDVRAALEEVRKLDHEKVDES